MGSFLLLLLLLQVPMLLAIRLGACPGAPPPPSIQQLHHT